MERISIKEQFATLQDPRVERTKRHQLLDVITIASCADFALAEDDDGDGHFAEVVGDGAADDATSDDADVACMSHGMVISKNSYSPPLVVCMKTRAG